MSTAPYVGYYLASLDLTDAYFTIPLHESVRRFTRFTWCGKTYEHIVIMFGLGPSARVFTMMVKVAILFLCKEFGIQTIGYLDDFLIQARNGEMNLLHAEVAALVFHCLGVWHQHVETSAEHYGQG